MSMAESKMPAMIWATCNGMSTRLPDGHRQFVGGWSEDKDRPRAEQFIRADLVEPLVEALIGLLKDYLAVFEDHPEIEPNWKPNDSFLVQKARAALQAYEAAQ